MRPRPIIAVLLLAAACNPPRYYYESRPVARPIDPSSCYESKRVELATGDFSWSQVTDTGMRISPGLISGYYTMTRSGSPQYEVVSGRGLVVHEGGQRLDAVAALERLGERELAARHRQQLDRTAGPAGRHPIYEKAAIGLVAVGTPLTVVGLGLLLAIDDPKPGGYTAIGGLTMLAVGGVFLIGKILSGKDYARHHRDQVLLVDREAAARVARAALEHNRRVAAACGVTADLPVTDKARLLLEGRR